MATEGGYRQVTLRIITPTAATVKSAALIAENYKSNRGKADRLAATLAAALAVAKANPGDAVEVTDFYPYEGGKSPLYNILHRVIGTDAFRQNNVHGRNRNLWSCVRPVALGVWADYRKNGNRYVHGDSMSSLTGEDIRLFVVHAE